tara:strand:- start:54 stop:188 length:135 start_codon:yes stop_codon:yes gene_type:complete
LFEDWFLKLKGPLEENLKGAKSPGPEEETKVVTLEVVVVVDEET